MRCWRAIIVAMSILTGPAFAAPDRAAALRIYEEEFRLRADRDFTLPSWRSLESEQGELAAGPGCLALGVDCSDAASGPMAAGRFLKRTIVSDDYRGTARLLRVRNGAFYAQFVAPEGYSPCRAGIYLKSGIQRGAATFAGSIKRSGVEGVSIYASLDSPDAVLEFRLLVLYAPAGGEMRGCWPDQTILFICQDGLCRPSRAYPQTDLR